MDNALFLSQTSINSGDAIVLEIFCSSHGIGGGGHPKLFACQTNRVGCPNKHPPAEKAFNLSATC
jgi:hypothetical protein